MDFLAIMFPGGDIRTDRVLAASNRLRMLLRREKYCTYEDDSVHVGT